jgi:hypothetical protein
LHGIFFFACQTLPATSAATTQQSAQLKPNCMNGDWQDAPSKQMSATVCQLMLDPHLSVTAPSCTTLHGRRFAPLITA